MNKSKIRKKILTIRKKKHTNKIQVNSKSIIKILRKKKIKNKIIGGYYPYNYEMNVIPVLEKFEKSNYLI